MLQTLVQREPANNQANSITDVLLSTLAAQISRGQSEINSNCSNRILVNSNIVSESFIPPTSIIQITDMEVGEMRGIVTGFTLSFAVDNDALSIVSSLKYEREE